MKAVKYWILVLLLVPFGAQAAIVNFWLNPQDSGPLSIDSSTTIDIMADWDAPMYSGAISFHFDPSIVHVTDVTVTVPSNLAMADGMPTDGSPATSGTVSPIGFVYLNFMAPPGESANNAAGEYLFATVELKAVGAGTSALDISSIDELEFIDPVNFDVFQWTNGDAPTDPITFNSTSGSVSVSAVPLPAAAWFMLSGLGFLAFRQRRA